MLGTRVATIGSEIFVTMRRYKDLGGDSGVTRYEAGRDSIAVEFKYDGAYLYTYASTGREKVEIMKRLASRGDGLATFINKHVRDRYAKKLK